MKRDMSNKLIIQNLYEKRCQYSLSNYIDEEDIEESLLYIKLVKKFFIKLHKNKDININLLVNHLILLFNSFNSNYIIKYLFYSINEEHRTYLKTILLYMNKIDVSNSLFENYSISYDFDFLLQSINNRVF